MELFLKTDADIIITDCGSCSSFLKEYHRFIDDPAKAEQIKQVINKVVDMTHWLADTKKYSEYVDNSEPERITYHDPCHLAHHLHEKESARSILKDLPNTTFVELNEADMCCGGAGSYNIAHYELSQKILARKLDNIEATGAQVVATACPACIMQLAYGVRKAGLPVQVKHINQLALEKSVRRE